MLDTHSIEARAALVEVKLLNDYDWKGANAEIASAQSVDPNVTRPLELVLMSGCISGPCYERYLSEVSRDIDHDPLNAFLLSQRAYVRYVAGDLDGAEIDDRRA